MQRKSLQTFKIESFPKIVWKLFAVNYCCTFGKVGRKKKFNWVFYGSGVYEQTFEWDWKK